MNHKQALFKVILPLLVILALGYGQTTGRPGGRPPTPPGRVIENYTITLDFPLPPIANQGEAMKVRDEVKAAFIQDLMAKRNLDRQTRQQRVAKFSQIRKRNLTREAKVKEYLDFIQESEKDYRNKLQKGKQFIITNTSVPSPPGRTRQSSIQWTYPNNWWVARCGPDSIYNEGFYHAYSQSCETSTGRLQSYSYVSISNAGDDSDYWGYHDKFFAVWWYPSASGYPVIHGSPWVEDSYVRMSTYNEWGWSEHFSQLWSRFSFWIHGVGWVYHTRPWAKYFWDDDDFSGQVVGYQQMYFTLKMNTFMSVGQWRVAIFGVTDFRDIYTNDFSVTTETRSMTRFPWIGLQTTPFYG